MATANTPDRPGSAQPNQSIQRGFEILELLAGAEAPMRTGDISRALGIGQSVASRLLLTLHQLGYVQRVGRGVWQPDIGLLALGSRAVYGGPLNHARPQLELLLGEAGPGMLVALGMLWQARVVYLFHSSQETCLSGLGRVYPMGQSSIGVLLERLPPPPSARVITSPGVWSVAVPVRWRGQYLGLAMSSRDERWHEGVVPMLQRYAAALETTLAAPPAAPPS